MSKSPFNSYTEYYHPMLTVSGEQINYLPMPEAEANN
jgi:hypothetical protein